MVMNTSMSSINATPGFNNARASFKSAKAYFIRSLMGFSIDRVKEGAIQAYNPPNVRLRAYWFHFL